MKKIISILAVLCILFSLSVPAFAIETPQIILDSRDAVLKINSYYDVAKTKFYGSGTGFLIGAKGGGSTIVCTNWHVVTNTNEESGSYGKPLPSVNIVSNRDIELTAEVLFASQKADFAILKLQNPIYKRTPLALADTKQLKGTETVYALGFPGLAEFVQDDATYRPEDVSVTSGNIGKLTTIENIPVIQHTAATTFGNSGGPLLSSNGAVIGINTYLAWDGVGSTLSYAIQISEIRNTLDDLGYTYLEAPSITDVLDIPKPTDPAENTTTTTTEPAEKYTITFNADGGNGGTEQTLEKGAMPAAPSVTKDGFTFDGWSPEVSAVSGNATYTAKWVKDADYTWAILAAVFVLLLIIAAVVIIVIKGKGKKAVAAPPQNQPMQMRPPMPPMQQPMAPHAPIQPPVQQAPIMQQPPIQPPVQQPRPAQRNDGTAVLGGPVGETTVLGANAAGETTVLSESELKAPTNSFLVRVKTGEKIYINRPLFRIGKDRSRVDYFIADNSAISRSHAAIVNKNGEFFIIDNNTTNHTYVNGEMIASNMETKLDHGAKIRFANEEYEFKLF